MWPVFILGGGCNVLFVSDFKGLVIHSAVRGVRKTAEDAAHVWLEVGAGEDWDTFVQYTIEHGYGGIENLSAIPGKVGAAPVQNIGAYGREAGQYVTSVNGFDIDTSRFEEYSAPKCAFGYRTSIFKNRLADRFVINTVTFRLDKKPDFALDYKDVRQETDALGGPTLQNIRTAIIAIRRRKLPDISTVGSAGSFFMNPTVSEEHAAQLRNKAPDIPLFRSGDKYKVAAAWLIEQCGWKGFRDGDTGTHPSHALALVNYGSATGAQIWELALKIQRSVVERFNIHLQPEVEVIGLG